MAKTKQEILKSISDYRLATYRQFIFCVNKNTEDDLINHIESKENFAGYLKGLIKKDMAKDVDKENTD